MVNAAVTFGVDPAMGHPERELAFSYAPRAARGALGAVFALDAALAGLARRTREPMVAQLRLAWWRDALAVLPDGAPAGQPILAALHTAALPSEPLVAVVDGWEALVAGDLAAYARGRGRGLFGAGAAALGAADAWIGDAGEGWALAEVALTSPDPAVAAAARDAAGPLLDLRGCPRASRAARPLGALALSARMDLAGGAEGSPRRIARLLRFRLIGR